jgi:hypothetical protein
MNDRNFVSTLPNHAYYTLNFRNNGSNGEAEDARVEYTEVRNSPYLMQPDLYACSIVRFSLTTATLPIFIPQMSSDFQTTNSALDTYQKTIYSVTMEYGNNVSRQYVKYIPQSEGLFPAPNGAVNQATNNAYYYIYQAAQFVVMVNNALAKAFQEVLPSSLFAAPVYIDWIDIESRAIFYAPVALCQEPGYASQPTSYGTALSSIGGGTVSAISGSGTAASPWIATVTLSSTTSVLTVGMSLTATAGTGSLFGGTPTLVAVTEIVSGTVFKYSVVGGTTPSTGSVTAIIPKTTQQLKVYFNGPLFNLFSSFQAKKLLFSYSTQNDTNGKHFRYQWWNVNNSKEELVDTFIPPDLLGRSPVSTKYVAINQSYSTVPLWNPVKSIVFTTALLPVLPEMVSAPQSIGATTRFESDGNNANVQNVLTDFEVELINGEETRPVVYYFPTAEYRMVDLQSNQPLSGIQLSINWRNKFGQLIPLQLGTDGNAQIKIMFRRRDWQA